MLSKMCRHVQTYKTPFRFTKVAVPLRVFASLNDEGKRVIAARAIAKAIDDRYGEMNYGGLFWKPAIKQATQ
jgi:hypothetical protein